MRIRPDPAAAAARRIAQSSRRVDMPEPSFDLKVADNRKLWVKSSAQPLARVFYRKSGASGKDFALPDRTHPRRALHDPAGRQAREIHHRRNHGPAFPLPLLRAADAAEGRDHLRLVGHATRMQIYRDVDTALPQKTRQPTGRCCLAG